MVNIWTLRVRGEKLSHLLFTKVVSGYVSNEIINGNYYAKEHALGICNIAQTKPIPCYIILHITPVIKSTMFCGFLSFQL